MDFSGQAKNKTKNNKKKHKQTNKQKIQPVQFFALSSLGYSGSKLIALCRPPPCRGTHVFVISECKASVVNRFFSLLFCKKVCSLLVK